MVCKAIFLFAAVCAHSVLGSIYHGPTAVPHVLKSGYLADTHEVAAAKGAHLAALAKESHNSYGYGGDYGSYGSDYGHSYDHGHDIKYHGPTAIPHVLKNGHIADTHEVAAAKGAHLAALAKESHSSYGYGGDYSGSYGGDHSYNHGHDMKYHGPIAIPHVLKNGHIADTHEVAVAKADHYAAVSKAKAYGGHGYAGDYGYGGSYGYSQGGHVGSYGGGYGHGHDIRYHGPIEIPHVLKNGHIADTHEVAVAKAEHYAAVSKAKAYGGHGYAGDYEQGQVGSFGHDYSHQQYQGELAIPSVLKSGYLADTHEVQAARQHHLQALHDIHY